VWGGGEKAEKTRLMVGNEEKGAEIFLKDLISERRKIREKKGGGRESLRAGRGITQGKKRVTDISQQHKLLGGMRITKGKDRQGLRKKLKKTTKKEGRGSTVLSRKHYLA